MFEKSGVKEIIRKDETTREFNQIYRLVANLKAS